MRAVHAIGKHAVNENEAATGKIVNRYSPKDGSDTANGLKMVLPKRHVPAVETNSVLIISIVRGVAQTLLNQKRNRVKTIRTGMVGVTSQGDTLKCGNPMEPMYLNTGKLCKNTLGANYIRGNLFTISTEKNQTIPCLILESFLMLRTEGRSFAQSASLFSIFTKNSSVAHIQAGATRR